MNRLNSFVSAFCVVLFQFGINAQDTLRPAGYIPILGWYGIPAEETNLARFIEMKEAGFTYNFTFYSNSNQVATALDTAYAAGMKILISCSELQTDPENTVAMFMNHPALGGYYLRDEPNRSDFAGLAQWARKIQSVDSMHFCYINLFPSYASQSQLGTSSYQEYLDAFLNEVPVEILSFDYYPVIGEINRSLRQGWYENLEMISRKAMLAGKPFWAFALATAINGAYPIPTEAELRLQMFSNLAYGAQGLQYFTYWTPPCGGECFHDGPIYNNQRTEVFYRVKTVNEEIKNLSSVFYGSKVLSVNHTGKDIPNGTHRLSELPNEIHILETIGKGAIVSVLERDSLMFLAIVNRDFKDSMKLIIKGDSCVRKFEKSGVIGPLNISNLTEFSIPPGDIMIFYWKKIDPVRFHKLKHLTAYFPMDYDLNDYSGNKCDATEAGNSSITFVNDQERGRVAYFDGDAHASLPMKEELKFENSDFSFSLWIKCISFTGLSAIVSNQDLSSQFNKGFTLIFSDEDHWKFCFTDGCGNVREWKASEYSLGSLADNHWHFIAVSIERAGYLNIYLDGKKQIGSISIPGSFCDEVINFPITLMSDGTGHYTNDIQAYLDDVRFWNRPLSEKEVAELYTSGIEESRPELIYLPLDYDLLDQSGNEFHAADAGTTPVSFVDDADRGLVAFFDRPAHAVFPNNERLRFGTNNFSFSLWLRSSSKVGYASIVSNKNLYSRRNRGFSFCPDSYYGDYWLVNFADGETEDGGSGNKVEWKAKSNGVSTIFDDKWHFIAVSFDRKNFISVFVDGKLMPGQVDMTACPGYAHDDVNNYPVTLMQDGTGKNGLDMPAYIDEFRMWDHTLTESFVSSLYQHTLKNTTGIVNNFSPMNAYSKIYPNPSKGAIYIDYYSNCQQEIKLLFYNLYGMLVFEKELTVLKGENQLNFDMNRLNDGLYFVRIVSSSGTELHQLILER